MRTHAFLLPVGLLVCGVLLAARAAAEPAQLYVATEGNDAWSGRLARPNATRSDGPLATLAAARDRLRKIRPEGATVLVRGGTYRLAEPLRLGPEDSGAPRAPITYAACPGEKVTLAGSRVVTGWKPFKAHIYQADLSDCRSAHRASGNSITTVRSRSSPAILTSTQSTRGRAAFCTCPKRSPRIA